MVHRRLQGLVRGAKTLADGLVYLQNLLSAIAWSTALIIVIVYYLAAHRNAFALAMYLIWHQLFPLLK